MIFLEWMQRILLTVFCTALALTFSIETQAQTAQESAFKWEAIDFGETTIGTENELDGHEVWREAKWTSVGDAIIGVGGKFYLGETHSRYANAIKVFKLNAKGEEFSEVDSATLAKARSNGAVVVHDRGVFYVGGENDKGPVASVDLIAWDESKGIVRVKRQPPLPISRRPANATVFNANLIVAFDDGAVYSRALETTPESDNELVWTELPSLLSETGRTCASAHLAVQNTGAESRLFGICVETRTGSTQSGYIVSTWMFEPAVGSHPAGWAKKQNVERNAIDASPLSFDGTSFGQSNILIFAKTGDSIDALIYNAITDRWRVLPSDYPGEMPATIFVSASSVSAISQQGRTARIWRATMRGTSAQFGWIDVSVIFVYLLAIVLVGIYFMNQNKGTDDFFRGGQNIPAWAAACSIYATMLSSLTYLALPALVFQTNWIIYIGIMMLVVVAPVAIYWVMPFFRQINATSAYEYLSLRFNLPVRMLASALFAIFHIGRIGIVLSLTALALAVATPLDAWQSVFLMGVLSLIYTALGGVTAVVWTDTIQTIVLVIGALICFAFIVMGIDGGLSALVEQGVSSGKFQLVDWNFGHDSWMVLSIWVIVLGGIGQNLASYTADQAVVQRYLVTADEKAAAKAIWLNAMIAVPGALLFFLIGSGLFFFYQSQPERLDPAIQLDQIFPTFIVNEIPVGIAGLIIAGVFAAAQSTVSTSMNSVATTIVTDFFRPMRLFKDDKHYLNAARILTVLIGVLGTAAGLLFISPSIRSLLEEFFKVIGMFMGALGGLFLLGITTRRVGSIAAFIGLLAGVALMAATWQLELANGFLFAAIGITATYIFALVASFVLPAEQRDFNGLTIHTLQSGNNGPNSRASSEADSN